ncbi:MAG: hypothetical protein J3K34DRAFT_425615 [Monoraphidium minutum]|nr:MAG: hypothetical protein J3K34DRAFT_425615 [Monoraphidium minutum]
MTPSVRHCVKLHQAIPYHVSPVLARDLTGAFGSWLPARYCTIILGTTVVSKTPLAARHGPAVEHRRRAGRPAQRERATRERLRPHLPSMARASRALAPAVSIIIAALWLATAALADLTHNHPHAHAPQDSATPESCVAMLRAWDPATKECAPQPALAAANCTWMDVEAGVYETTLRWTLLNACASKRPLLIAKIMGDDTGRLYAQGFTKLPFAGAAVLSYTDAPGGSDTAAVFASAPAPGGRLGVGRPLSLCGDAAFGGKGGHCLVAGNDTSKEFKTTWEPSDGTYTLEGALVGGKPRRAKECGKALHPAARPLQYPGDCRPGCGMRLKLTQC